MVRVISVPYADIEHSGNKTKAILNRAKITEPVVMRNISEVNYEGDYKAAIDRIKKHGTDRTKPTPRDAIWAHQVDGFDREFDEQCPMLITVYRQSHLQQDPNDEFRWTFNNPSNKHAALVAIIKMKYA